eukprot:6800430-Prymnesium_polylepis.1
MCMTLVCGIFFPLVHAGGLLWSCCSRCGRHRVCARLLGAAEAGGGRGRHGGRGGGHRLGRLDGAAQGHPGLGAVLWRRD